MKILLLIFFLISCGSPQNDQPPDSSKPVNGKSKAEQKESSPGSGEQTEKVDTAKQTQKQEGDQPDEQAPVEPPPPEPLSFSACDRTPIIQDFLIREATPFWRTWWHDLSCEELMTVHLEGIEELNLSFEGITELKTGDFADMPALKILNLSNNVISSVEAGWFSRLENLETLGLAYNRINHVDPHAFAGLNKLNRLTLKGNKIDNLPPELITPLTSLKSIDLSNNLIKSLPENFFDGFKHLTNVNLQNNLFEGPVSCGASPPGTGRSCKH